MPDVGCPDDVLQIGSTGDDPPMRNENDKQGFAPNGGARVETTATQDGTTTGKLVTRAQAARILGMSHTQVRRLEGTDLHPVVDARGWHWFNESAVRELARRRRATETTAAITLEYDGHVAAQAFRMFDAGSDAVDAVEELEIHPVIATALHREWANVRGGFFVTAKIAVKIRDCPCIATEATATTAEQLLEMLEDAYTNPCRVCDSRGAHVCTGCIVHRARSAMAYAKAHEAEAEKRYAEYRKAQAQAEAQRLAREASERATQAAGPEGSGGAVE